MSPQLTINKRPAQHPCFDEMLGEVSLRMMQIPGGRFTMGSPETEPERLENEGPQHDVAVQSFFMGKHPVTQAQWRFAGGLEPVSQKIAMQLSPSEFQGDMHPVEQVSWYEAIEFCDRLSRYTKRQYRLPTEAEWEYACRAGTITSFHFGETIATDVANYNGADEDYGAYGRGLRGKYRQKITPVDHFDSANAWGLCDMHGNVFEWCQDHWHVNYEGAPTDGGPWLSDTKNADRIIRGGSWPDSPRDCRSAFRSISDPSDCHSYIGFRVVCVVQSIPDGFQRFKSAK